MLGYLIAFVLGFVCCKFLPTLQRRGFAYVMAYFSASADPRLEAFKRAAFDGIGKLQSYFPEMKKVNSLKILEIGVGTGTNFQFYPENCHLVVVDPNPFFKKYYDDNRKKFPQIQSEEIIVATGEEMDMVPDCSVDVVVITLVLCSVKNTKKLLKQVLRVLVPGGKLYFIEHIREWDTQAHGTRAFLQNILSNTGIWPSLFDGCILNRNTDKDIQEAGFSEMDIRKEYAPIYHPVFQIVASQMVGSATK